MAFTVQFAVSARNDLRAIHAYISERDSKENADYVAREIVRTALSLRDAPNRGSYPPELMAGGIRTYRQVFFKPYRILYRVRGNTVVVAVIADGRRDMDSLLARRLRPD
jgi:toxin ParE1/3/4